MRSILLYLGPPVVSLLICVVFFYSQLYSKLSGPLRSGQILESYIEEPATNSFNKLEVKSAQIVIEKDDEIVIRYRYSGYELQDTIFICGGVGQTMSYSFGCKAQQLQAPAGEVKIRYRLSSHAKMRECSNTVYATFYKPRGSEFYKHSFKLNKVWHKQPSLKSWYNYHTKGCSSKV